MVVLGLLLVLAAVVVSAAVLGGTGSGSLHTAGVSIGNLSFAEIFIGGALAMLALVLGLWLMTSSAARKRRRRLARREQERSLAAERDHLAAQRTTLEQRLTAEREAHERAMPPRENQVDLRDQPPVRPGDIRR